MNKQENIPRVSVIIPTRNGEPWLDRVLGELRRQTLVPAEILVVDSGSTDRSVAIARGHGVRILEIAPARFDHGGTRTMAAKESIGEILVYMTQDAVVAGRESLARLVAPLVKDSRIAASYGRQLPAEDADPFAAHLRLHNYPEASQVRCWQDRHRYGFKTIFISNSFAAYKKEVLAAYGYFPERQIFAEDSCLLARLIENGYCVAYVADALVHHSHNYSMLQDARRYFDIGVFHATHSDLLEKFGRLSGAGRAFVRSELSYLFRHRHYYLFPVSLCRNALKYLAYRLGLYHASLPSWLPPRLSMHRMWWR